MRPLFPIRSYKLKTKYALIPLLVSTLLAAATPAVAELKIGMVNTQRIFQSAPAAIKAAKKLEQEFARRWQELQALEKQLQATQSSLEKNAVTLSESERRNKEREVGELSRDFQRKQREFREDFNMRQNDENAALIDKANRVIRQIAESEKFDLILQEAVYVNPQIDITDKVIRALTE